MTLPAHDLPTEHHPSDWPGHPAIESRESRNLFLLAAHQIVFRIGWIFKTESVIMPAFLDTITGGSGLMRGCLPVLSRLGQGVPPLFSANYLRAMRLKKRALVWFTGLMCVPFLVLWVVWLLGRRQTGLWMAAVFLALYSAFFVLYGLYLVSFGTVQGKLIRPTRRGYLILLTTFWGAIPATLAALALMPGWLGPSPPCWGNLFACVGVLFFVSSLIALMLFEPGSETSQRRADQLGSLAETVRVLRRDSNLRCLVLVAVLFGSGLIVVPHYQASPGPHPCGGQLTLWVVVQNLAVAVFALLAGPLADRRGYRLTSRLLIFASAVAPVLAISLSHLSDDLEAKLFWLVYLSLGVTPLVPRTLLNYALEICEPQSHPRYQAVVSLALAAPFLLSPAVGWLVDVIGFGWVFFCATLLVLLGAMLTFRLDEPRRRLGGDQAGAADVAVPE